MTRSQENTDDSDIRSLLKRTNRMVNNLLKDDQTQFNEWIDEFKTQNELGSMGLGAKNIQGVIHQLYENFEKSQLTIKQIDKKVEQLKQFELAKNQFDIRIGKDTGENELKIDKKAKNKVHLEWNDQQKGFARMLIGNWFFYFLNIDETHGKEPKLGRAIVKISEPNIVVFENVGSDRNYYGHFDFITSTVLHFDLWSEYRTCMLHFKARVQEGANDVIFANYSTYDGHKLYSGASLLHRSDKKNPESKIFHYSKSPQEIESVPEKIWDFLSLKQRNYYLLPKPRPSLDSFESWVQDLDPFKHTKTRFLEYQKPKLFVASPKSSSQEEFRESNQKAIEDLLRDLETHIGDEVDIYERQKINWVSEADGSYQLLKRLQRTRFFILIITEIDKASFSLVQLGWALAHCKYILLLYNSNSVSSRMLALDKLPIRTVPFYGTLEDNRIALSKKICAFVKGNLEKP